MFYDDLILFPVMSVTIKEANTFRLSLYLCLGNDGLRELLKFKKNVSLDFFQTHLSPPYCEFRQIF